MSEGTAVIHHQDSGAGTPILCVHGALVHGAMFDRLLPDLRSACRPIVPDLRGHGRSSALPGPYTVEQHVEDLIRLLDVLGIGTLSVLGYSQGGAVAQFLARHHPERIRHLFLVCTYAHNLATRRERLEGCLISLVLRRLGTRRFAWLMARAVSELDAESAQELHAMVAGNDDRLALATWEALRTFDSRGWLSEIRVPTTIIAGGRDEAVPIHHAEMLRDGITDANLVVLEGAGHLLAWTHAEQLAAIILDRLPAD